MLFRSLPASPQAAKAKAWNVAPYPCIGVCKYGSGGMCRGCTMTRAEKKSSKRLLGKGQKKAFFTMLAGRLVAQERYPKWAKAYRKRCAKRGLPCVLDKLEPKLGLASTKPR